MITLDQFKKNLGVVKLGFYNSKVEGSNRKVGSVTMKDGTEVRYITSKTLDANAPKFVATVEVPDVDQATGEELDTTTLLHVICNAREFDMEL